MEGHGREKVRPAKNTCVKAQTNMDFSFAPLDVKEDYISPFSFAAYILRKFRVCVCVYVCVCVWERQEYLLLL
jgi:hypothetical protein